MMSALEKISYLQAESEKVTDSKHSPKVVTSNQFSSIQKTRMEDLDSRWALVVSFASCFMNFTTAGLGRMYGIFFMAFIKIFDFNRKIVSVLFSDRFSTRNLLDPFVGIFCQKYAACKVIKAGGTVVTICFVVYFCTTTWRSVIWYRVNDLCAFLAINLLKLIIAQILVKCYVYTAGMVFSFSYVRFLMLLVLLEDFLSIRGIEDAFLIVKLIMLYITVTLLKKGVQKNWKMPCLKESFDNLWREEGGVINIKKSKFTSMKEVTPTTLTRTITKERLEEEINLRFFKTSIQSVNEYTPKKYTLRDTIRKSYSYPDMKFLKENSELVLKIINFKNIDSSNTGTEVSENALSFMDEIERLCSSLRNSQLVSQFHKNLRNSKRNLFGEEKMVYLKVPCDPRYGSFHFRRESTQTETPRRHSLPDFSKLAINGSRTCLKKLYKLELNKQQIITTYPEEKEQILLVLSELCKLNKLNF